MTIVANIIKIIGRQNKLFVVGLIFQVSSFMQIFKVIIKFPSREGLGVCKKFGKCNYLTFTKRKKTILNLFKIVFLCFLDN